MLIACEPASRPEADSESSADTTTRDPVRAGSAEWVIHPRGTRDLRVGMNYSELAPFMANPQDTIRYGDGCDYVSITDAPDSVRFMVEGRRLVRIEAVGAGAQTREGAMARQSEAEILRLYPGARRQPHKYTDGSYLIVLPYAPSDTLHRYVFETDGSRVVMVRAGVYPPVEYVEGCS